MEVAPGVHVFDVGGEGEGVPSTHVYWVQGSEGGAFIDTGFPETERTGALLGAWKALVGTRPPRWSLLSHWHHEHAGGARVLRAATGARVAAGRGDAERIAQAAGGAIVDRPLDGGEVFDFGERRIQAIATPGHTPGTFCYFLEGDRILFTGDHIMGSGSVAVRSNEGGNMVQYLASLRKLLPLDARLILSGHGPAVQDPRAKIEEYLRHRAEREAQIVTLLREGVTDVDALVARLYAGVNPRLHGLAREQVVAHLEKLREEARAAVVEGNKAYRLLR